MVSRKIRAPKSAESGFAPKSQSGGRSIRVCERMSPSVWLVDRTDMRVTRWGGEKSGGVVVWGATV